MIGGFGTDETDLGLQDNVDSSRDDAQTHSISPQPVHANTSPRHTPKRPSSCPLSSTSPKQQRVQSNVSNGKSAVRSISSKSGAKMMGASEYYTEMIRIEREKLEPIMANSMLSIQ